MCIKLMTELLEMAKSFSAITRLQSIKLININRTLCGHNVANSIGSDQFMLLLRAATK